MSSIEFLDRHIVNGKHFHQQLQYRQDVLSAWRLQNLPSLRAMAVSAYSAELLIRTVLCFITACVMSGCGLCAVCSPPFTVFARQTSLVCLVYPLP